MAKTQGRGGKTWGGRFQGKTHPLVEAYTLSLPVDRRMWREEIAASIAHARMLGRQRIIKRAEASAIISGLREIGRDIANDKFRWRDDLDTSPNPPRSYFSPWAV